MISEIFRAVSFEAAPMFFANYFCFFQVCLRNNFFFAVASSFVTLLEKILYSCFMASLPFI